MAENIHNPETSPAQSRNFLSLSVTHYYTHNFVHTPSWGIETFDPS